MADPWIRVHAALIDKPVIARAVTALGVNEHAAVGLLVTFWGAVSRNVVGGMAGPATDAQLELWARWRGKRGRFAAFIRSQHIDIEGRVNEWDDYAGALEQRRAKERDRLRNKRTDVAQQNASVATRAPERNDTIRDEENRGGAPPVQGAPVKAPSAARTLAKIKSLAEVSEVPGQGRRTYIRKALVEELGPKTFAAYQAIGGAEAVLNTPGEKWAFLVRDFERELRSA